jgi:CelD/BcsL family acetyltransferase involved in cellulose biosynthesis
LGSAIGFTTGLASFAPAPDRARAAVAPFAHCDVYDDLAPARAAWVELEQLAAGSPYQTYEFLDAWQRTIGRAQGVTPMIVVARDAAGRISAVLPLGRSRRGVVWAAEFLGGAHANFRMGLFRPGLEASRAAIVAVLRRAARMTRPRVDVFWLANQPVSWQGAANPMAILPRRPSPSFGYKSALSPDFALWHANHHARDTRRKLRNKRLRLNALGPVSLVLAQDEATARTVLAAFGRQKEARLRAARLPNPYADPVTTRFLEIAATEGLAQGVQALTLFALMSGERVLATLGGVARGGRFCGAFISHDPDPAIARCSPGQLLILEAVRDLGARGFSTFDLGVGEADYKESTCEADEPLFDTAVAATWLGFLFGKSALLRQRIKRRIKRTPWARRIAGALQRRASALRKRATRGVAPA